MSLFKRKKTNDDKKRKTKKESTDQKASDKSQKSAKGTTGSGIGSYLEQLRNAIETAKTFPALFQKKVDNYASWNEKLERAARMAGIEYPYSDKCQKVIMSYSELQTLTQRVCNTIEENTEFIKWLLGPNPSNSYTTAYEEAIKGYLLSLRGLGVKIIQVRAADNHVADDMSSFTQMVCGKTCDEQLDELIKRGEQTAKNPDANSVVQLNDDIASLCKEFNVKAK